MVFMVAGGWELDMMYGGGAGMADRQIYHCDLCSKSFSNGGKGSKLSAHSKLSTVLNIWPNNCLREP
jgi:hypothetical protein